MFSVYPQYNYGHDDFYSALAAQRARERREAEYRARLQEARQRQQFEEALRHNAYQNYLAREQRRHSMHPYFGGFDSDEEYSESPYVNYFEPAYGPRQSPRSQDFLDNLRRHQMATQEPRRPAVSLKRRESPTLSQDSPESSTKADSQRSAQRSPVHSRSSPPIESTSVPIRIHSPEPNPIHSSRPTSVPVRIHSPKPDVRDQAARKIQAFFRANLPRHKSLKAISSVAQEFQHIVDSFTFPASLDFAESQSMELLYTPKNAPVHLYEHTLSNLLSKLDSIDSHGDKHVRAVRKDLVKTIEGELSKLDANKVALWEALKSAPVVVLTENDESRSSIMGDSMLQSGDTTPMEILDQEESVNQALSPEGPLHGDQANPLDGSESSTTDAVEEQSQVETSDSQVAERNDSRPPDEGIQDEATRRESSSDNVASACEIVVDANPSDNMEVGPEQPSEMLAVLEVSPSVNATVSKSLDDYLETTAPNNYTLPVSSAMPIEITS